MSQPTVAKTTQYGTFTISNPSTVTHRSGPARSSRDGRRAQRAGRPHMCGGDLNAGAAQRAPPVARLEHVYKALRVEHVGTCGLEGRVGAGQWLATNCTDHVCGCSPGGTRHSVSLFGEWPRRDETGPFFAFY